MKAPARRKMGVYLDDLNIRRVLEGTAAAEAGWEAGDVIVSVNGEEMGSRRELNVALQLGDSKVAVNLKRGDEIIETVLDYSDDPEEEARARWRERQAKRDAEREDRPRRGRRGQGN